MLRTWNSEKRYRITDSAGQPMYTAVEESSWCGRCCLGKCRGWIFHVFDLQSHEVLRIERHLRAASCCFPCCLQVRLFIFFFVMSFFGVFYIYCD